MNDPLTQERLQIIRHTTRFRIKIPMAFNSVSKASALVNRLEDGTWAALKLRDGSVYGTREEGMTLEFTVNQVIGQEHEGTPLWLQLCDQVNQAIRALL